MRAVVVNCCLKRSVKLHDALHGFRKGWGTRTATLESKMAHHLAGISHEPLFQVLLDVRKEYNSIDRGWCLEILRGYGLGPNMARILTHYWEQHSIVPKVGKFLRKDFGTGRGVTQGKTASPIILNIVVDTVVRMVIDVVCGTQEEQHGLGWAVGERNMIFYADDNRISRRDHDWVQDALVVTVTMFRRVGLDTNLENTNYMVCVPCFI